MDKRVIFAVAGSGKTTHIVDSLSDDKRFLIITYTISNYKNLSRKIAKKYGGAWPDNVTLMTYFQFLFRFCYKPFLADKVKAHGIRYEQKPALYVKQSDRRYYLSSAGYFYSNRLSLFLEKENVVDEIKGRIEKYFDVFVIDEIQDIAGRDFNFLKVLMETSVNMLFVGDFFQHTFDTSRDGNVNQSLFNNREAYEAHFIRKGFTSDTTTLLKSWRCGKKICEFVSTKLGISISSNKDETDTSDIFFISSSDEAKTILADPNIVKLHYKECDKFGFGHRNWGDTKGEDSHENVCVMLNKTTADLHKKGKLCQLTPSTRNKLYVAITRAHGNVYLVYE